MPAIQIVEEFQVVKFFQTFETVAVVELVVVLVVELVVELDEEEV